MPSEMDRSLYVWKKIKRVSTIYPVVIGSERTKREPLSRLRPLKEGSIMFGVYGNTKFNKFLVENGRSYISGQREFNWI